MVLVENGRGLISTSSEGEGCTAQLELVARLKLVVLAASDICVGNGGWLLTVNGTSGVVRGRLVVNNGVL